MFMVLDLMLGGDLKFLLRKTGRMPEEWVKFYCAEMIVALEYCHQQKIVHRDIKPDNLLLDEKGHVHLTDFNVATYLPQDGSPLTSFSGTVSYMAPEVLRKSGYREEADWWSVAVVAFELLFGKKPFRAASSREVMTRITHSEFNFPSSSLREISDECMDFISCCFERDITKRLGYNGVEELKRHPFFTGIDWEKIPKKELHPPFTPNVRDSN
jgi:serine/threonine kinase 32